MSCALRDASGGNRRTPILGRLLLKEATNVGSAKWGSSNCRYAPQDIRSWSPVFDQIERCVIKCGFPVRAKLFTSNWRAVGGKRCRRCLHQPDRPAKSPRRH